MTANQPTSTLQELQETFEALLNAEYVTGVKSAPSSTFTIKQDTLLAWGEELNHEDDPDGSIKYPIEAFGKFAYSLKALSALQQVPPCVAGASMLSAFSLATQHIADVIQPVTGTRIPISLFFASFLDSGDRKSSTDKIALGGFDVATGVLAYEASLQNEAEGLARDYAIYSEAYEAAVKNIKRGTKGNVCTDPQEIARKLSAHPQPIKPYEGVLRVGKCSTEGLEDAFKRNYPSLFLGSDEGASILGSYAMKTENKTGFFGVIATAFDGVVIPSHTRHGENGKKALNVRLTSHIMIQGNYIPRLFGDREGQGQGSLARFLYSWPTPFELASDQRIIPFHLEDGRPVFESWVARNREQTYRLISEAHQAAFTAINTRPSLKARGGLSPRALPCDNQATALWLGFYNEMMANGCKGSTSNLDEMTFLKAQNSRAPENCLRLAGVLTLIDNPDAQTVTGEAMKRAITLSRYYRHTFLRLLNRDNKEANTQEQETIINLLKSEGPLNAPQVAERLGLPYDTVKKRLQRMRGNNLIKKDDEKNYFLHQSHVPVSRLDL